MTLNLHVPIMVQSCTILYLQLQQSIIKVEMSQKLHSHYRGKQIWDMLKDPCFWRCWVEIVVHIRLMNIEMIDELEALQLWNKSVQILALLLNEGNRRTFIWFREVGNTLRCMPPPSPIQKWTTNQKGGPIIATYAQVCYFTMFEQLK
jgi:hypothetical protein